VPIAHQKATQIRPGFSIREAWADWAVNGFSVTYETGSERAGK
jgi:hypothetical protein